MLHKYLLSLLKRCSDGSGDKVVLGHNLADLNVEIRHKTHITVCKNTDELSSLVTDGNTGDLVFLAEIFCVISIMIGSQTERSGNNTVF